MNARQAKKRAKYCYFMGIADAFLHKLKEIEEKATSDETVDLTLYPTAVGIGHNQHGFCRFAAFGQRIYKKYHV